jgi:hypothetical protein
MPKIVSVVAAASLLSAMAGLAFAQSSTSERTPGHLMQNKGSVKGQPGASGYAPGHVMQQKGSRKGYPGASGWTPSHNAPTTTGQGTRSR